MVEVCRTFQTGDVFLGCEHAVVIGIHAREAIKVRCLQPRGLCEERSPQPQSSAKMKTTFGRGVGRGAARGRLIL